MEQDLNPQHWIQTPKSVVQKMISHYAACITLGSQTQSLETRIYVLMTD